MNNYVLNRETALVLNGKVFALVREDKVTTNEVCKKCSLRDLCIDEVDYHKLTDLCIPDYGSEQWFFVEAGQLTKFQQCELEKSISINISFL